MLFEGSQPVARPIGHADIEFYESRMVTVTARALCEGARPPRVWESLSHRSRQRYLDRAVAVVGALVNDAGVRERIRILARDHEDFPAHARVHGFSASKDMAGS